MNVRNIAFFNHAGVQVTPRHDVVLENISRERMEELDRMYDEFEADDEAIATERAFVGERSI